MLRLQALQYYNVSRTFGDAASVFADVRRRLGALDLMSGRVLAVAGADHLQVEVAVLLERDAAVRTEVEGRDGGGRRLGGGRRRLRVGRRRAAAGRAAAARRHGRVLARAGRRAHARAARGAQQLALALRRSGLAAAVHGRLARQTRLRFERVLSFLPANIQHQCIHTRTRLSWCLSIPHPFLRLVLLALFLGVS